MSPEPLPASDEQARALAQSEFDSPVAVEAGAGTGKTTVLVARVLAWCLGRGWNEARHRLLEEADASPRPAEPTPEEVASRALDGVVAITFTEAAAAEMATRVASALAAVAADRASELVGFHPRLLEPIVAGELLPSRARALIGSLDRLSVQTIHSYCWNLLATYPMAAGLAPELRVDADGGLLEEIVREVVEPAVKQAYDDPGAHPLGQLALRMVDPRLVAEALILLIGDGIRAEALSGDSLGPDARRRILRRLIEATAAAERGSLPLVSQKRARKSREVAELLQVQRDALRRLPERPDRPVVTRLLDGLRENWTDDRLQVLQRWAKQEFGKTEQDVLGDASAELSSAAESLARLISLYRRIDVELLDAARRALQPLIGSVEIELRARGVATYGTLLSQAWRLLADRPAVRRRERSRIRQLLVDEFQDTDRLQCELVRLLTLADGDGPRPGLFVVGDPKQSIYGWRDADLSAYEAFLEQLVAAGGTRVQLRRNFRSVPAILAEVDRVVAPVMIAEAGLQPRFERLETSPSLESDSGFRAAGRAPVEYWLSWRTDGSPEEARGAATGAAEAARLEAAAIAADIRELHDGEGLPWSSFGVLMRSSGRMETFLEAFRRTGVPFAVSRDKSYFRRREVIEAAALIRAIIHPVDHLALVTLLRSPIVGVPDAALLPLWRRDFPDLVTRLRGPDDETMTELRSLLQEVAADLPSDIPGLDGLPDWPLHAAAALENLALLRSSLAVDPADRFLELLRQRFLLDVSEAARYLGPYRLANLDRFFARLEAALEERSGDLEAVLRSLRRGVAEAREAEEASPEGATAAAVQVMTIHAAKGLEFEHVYLVQLHARGRRSQQPTVRGDRRWIPGQPVEYILFGSPTPGFDEVERHDAEVEAAERVRTLYVAMTRAQRRLVLLGCWPDRPGDLPARHRDTYLELLQSRTSLPASMTVLLDTCRREDVPFVDDAEARWRFPALGASSAERLAEPPEEAALPSAKDLARQAERLRRHRQSARQRMERPFTATAAARESLPDLLGAPVGAHPEGTDRVLALRVGEAFHRLLENWDVTADPAAELSRQHEIQQRWLASVVDADRSATAQERFDGLCERFRGGVIFTAFIDLADHFVARELPVVLPPASETEGPTGFITGSIDLVYRDPRSDSMVIVDYKTDAVADASDLGARAAIYESQEAIYARALQEAWSLAAPPDRQLWFIWPDRIWRSGS